MQTTDAVRKETVEPMVAEVIARITDEAAEATYETSKEFGERVDTGEVVADTITRFISELTYAIANSIGGICKDVNERVNRWMEHDKE